MEIIFLYKVTLKSNHLFYIPLNIQTIQVLEVMVLKFWISKYYALKYLIFRRYEVKALWFWKRIIFGISDKIWFWVLKWYRIHGYEMECLFWFLKYNLFLNDRGVIITMGWQRDRDRIWTYSLSIPKTTLTNRVRGGDSRMK